MVKTGVVFLVLGFLGALGVLLGGTFLSPDQMTFGFWICAATAAAGAFIILIARRPFWAAVLCAGVSAWGVMKHVNLICAGSSLVVFCVSVYFVGKMWKVRRKNTQLTTSELMAKSKGFR